MFARSRLACLTTFTLLVVALAGCAPEPSPPSPSSTSAASKEHTSTPVPTASPSAPPPEEAVTFTYECHVEMPDETNPMGTTAPFSTWEEVWREPDISFCKANRHGSVLTETQLRAIEIGAPAYGSTDRYVILEGLSVQCAITANGYINIPTLSGGQVDEVKGFLTLCPDRPGAEQLRSALPSS